MITKESPENRTPISESLTAEEKAALAATKARSIATDRAVSELARVGSFFAFGGVFLFKDPVKKYLALKAGQKLWSFSSNYFRSRMERIETTDYPSNNA